MLANLRAIFPHRRTWWFMGMDVHPTKNGINRYWSIPSSRNGPNWVQNHCGVARVMTGCLLLQSYGYLWEYLGDSWNWVPAHASDSRFSPLLEFIAKSLSVHSKIHARHHSAMLWFFHIFPTLAMPGYSMRNLRSARLSKQKQLFLLKHLCHFGVRILRPQFLCQIVVP